MGESSIAAPPMFTPAFVQDPYPTYHRHLEGPALQPLEIRPGNWGVFRHADCTTWFRDPRLSSERSVKTIVAARKVPHRCLAVASPRISNTEVRA